jgi:pyridoxine 4-dehydrogenase
VLRFSSRCALVELRDKGKVRHIGISGASPEMLQRAQRITPISAVQNRLNLIDRSGVEVLDACERDRIAYVPYIPLATGALTDRHALIAPARRLGVCAATVALAWLLRRSQPSRDGGGIGTHRRGGVGAHRRRG